MDRKLPGASPNRALRTGSTVALSVHFGERRSSAIPGGRAQWIFPHRAGGHDGIRTLPKRVTLLWPPRCTFQAGRRRGLFGCGRLGVVGRACEIEADAGFVADDPRIVSRRNIANVTRAELDRASVVHLHGHLS